MPFNERLKEFFKAAQGNQCQTMVYDEEHGWHICGATDHLEVDHLTPESELFAEGRDKNDTEGIVRCQPHHTGMGLARDDTGETYLAGYGEPDWSRHPDMGQARQDYRDGNPNAFKEASQGHRDAIHAGERITNDDWSVTEGERDRVKDMTGKYLAESGEIYPDVKKSTKKKHWTDGLF